MKHNWEYKPFNLVADTIIPRVKLEKSDYLQCGAIPIISQEESFISGYCNNPADITPHNTDVVIFGDHSRVIKYVDCDFVVGADGVKIIAPKKCISSKFLYHFLKWYNVPSLGYARHFKLIKEATYPVPPMQVQEQIVAELDKINEVIEDCRELLRNLDTLAQSLFYDTFGDPVTNPKGWMQKRLKEVSLINPNKNEIQISSSNFVSFLPMEDLRINANHFTPIQSKRVEEVKNSYTYFSNNDVIFAKVTPCFENGKAGIPENLINGIGFGSSELYVIRPNKDYLNRVYLYFLIRSEEFVNEGLKNLSGTSGLRRIKRIFVENFQIPVPPLPLQEKFAARIEQIEAQKKAVEQTIAELQTLLDSRMDYWFN